MDKRRELCKQCMKEGKDIHEFGSVLRGREICKIASSLRGQCPYPQKLPDWCSYKLEQIMIDDGIKDEYNVHIKKDFGDVK